MLNLEPLIARLVEDVLRALRSATLAELRGLGLATNEAPEARPSKASRPPPATARARAPRAPKVRVAPRKRSAAGRAAAPVRVAPPEPATGEDITDPEHLLATSWAPAPERAPAPAAEGASAWLDEPPPPSSIRPAAESPVALRAGETLARSSGAGVVIRRAKKK